MVYFSIRSLVLCLKYSLILLEYDNRSISPQCPVHSGDYLAALSGHYRNLYNQLIESNQEDEESDMEASDEEVGMAEPDSDHLPLGTSFRDDDETATCKTQMCYQ